MDFEIRFKWITLYRATGSPTDSPMEAVLNILQILLSDIRTIDEGAVTLVRVDSHNIALIERLLRGMSFIIL